MQVGGFDEAAPPFPLDHARAHAASGTGGVIVGDARHAHALATDRGLVGQVALLLTSPPYGHSTHGQVRSTRESGRPGVAKWDHSYGKSPDNLARGSHDRLLTGFTDILTGCLPLLRLGGIVAITTRPFRQHGHLVDFPGQVWAAAQEAGLHREERRPSDQVVSADPAQQRDEPLNRLHRRTCREPLGLRLFCAATRV